MSGPEWSAYRWDTRVTWKTSGSPADVQASIIDPVDFDDNSRLVCLRSGQIVVVGALNESASLRDEGDRYNQRLQVFATVDEAIAAVIGEARQPSVIETEHGRASVVPIYRAHLQYEQRFITGEGHVYDVRSDYPHTGGLVVGRLKIYGAPADNELFEGEPADEVWLLLAWL
jgi:hypothetical protein